MYVSMYMDVIRSKDLMYNYIKEVRDNSNSFMKRVRVSFLNGYSISIVSDEFSYWGKRGLYEIAYFDKDGNMNGGLLNIEYDEGYLSKNDVLDRMAQLAKLK